MYKYLLESAGNINWMAIAALLTFVTVFVLSTILVMRKDKKFIHKMANLPFEDGSENHNIKNDNNNEK
jgi:uncharacterized membrane protein (DUF485 family)